MYYPEDEIYEEFCEKYYDTFIEAELDTVFTAGECGEPAGSLLSAIYDGVAVGVYLDDDLMEKILGLYSPHSAHGAMVRSYLREYRPDYVIPEWKPSPPRLAEV